MAFRLITESLLLALTLWLAWQAFITMAVY